MYRRAGNKYDLIAFDMDGTLVKSSGLSDCNGNAMGHVKEVAKVIVADHDGCAEAIYNYLL